MPSKTNFSAALEKARHDATIATIGNAGLGWLYKGTQPAGPGTTHANVLIAGPWTLGSPFGSATTALPSVLSITLPSNVNAITADQATFLRITNSAGTDGGAGIIDLSAGVSGCDVTVGPTTIGQPVAWSSAAINSANFGH